MLREGFDLTRDYDLLNHADLIKQHLPERGERKKSYLVVYSCGSCCSCCCCCLHTLGGVIGAAVAGDYCPEDDVHNVSDTWEGTAEPRKHLPSSQGQFWSSFFSVIVIGAVIASNFEPWDDPTAPAESIYVLVLIFGPAWMLGASLLAALRIAIRRDLPCRDRYWAQLGKITGGMLLGTLVGLLVMGLLAMLITGGR